MNEPKACLSSLAEKTLTPCTQPVAYRGGEKKRKTMKTNQEGPDYSVRR